jgi:iron(III) transport system ATP-binding protein
VALARALASKPQLVLLDEPFSALDAGLRAETRRAVLNALRLAQATAILVTHDQAEALSLSDEVAVLLEGRLVQVAAPTTLYNRPRTAAVARFLGEVNLMPGQILGSSVDCALGRLDLAIALPDGPAEVLIRPEQIRVRQQNEPTSLTGKIVSLEYYGHDMSVGLDVSGLQLMARAASDASNCVGDHVGIAIEGPVVVFT